MDTLPRYLRHGLRLVCVGFNPSIYSVLAGHYYARPGNTFWRHLGASGLTAREVKPEDDTSLMDEAGIGFTDLCARPTVSAAELSRDEIREGAQRLSAELVDFQPLVALFNGRGIYTYFVRYALGCSAGGAAQPNYGGQADRVGSTRIWVVPSSSGRASKWHTERLQWLVRLAEELRETQQ